MLSGGLDKFLVYWELELDLNNDLIKIQSFKKIEMEIN